MTSMTCRAPARRTSVLARGLAALIVGFCSQIAWAHEGHDHGPPQAAAGAPSPRAVATSENYQFVAIAEGEVLVIYLDRAADNAPVVDATIEVTLDGTVLKAEAQRGGTYEIVAPKLKTAGTYEVLASISEAGRSDLLVGAITIPNPEADTDAHSVWDHLPSWVRSAGLGNSSAAVFAAVIGIAGAAGFIFLGWRAKRRVPLLLIAALLGAAPAFAPTNAAAHEGAAAPTTANGNGPSRRPDGMIFLPKPTQRLLEVRTRIVAQETAIPSRRFAGRVIANPNKSGVVQSTISGRYMAPESGVPPIGTSVKAGDLLGRVAPSFASIDASQLAQQMAELDQQITIARAKLTRIEPLLQSQAVAKGQVDEARLTLEGLLKRRADLATAKAQPEDLRAPVDGVIAVARVVSGQVVGPTDQVFQIIDASSLLVEALVFGFNGLADLGNATALLADGRIVKLRYIGRSRALQQQYAQVQFAIVDGDSTLDVGLPVKVVAQSGAPVTGINLPRAALTQAPNGQTVAFVQKEPELFEPRPVRFEPFDAEGVRIIGGIEPGETVVVKNAPLVAQVR